MGCTRLVGVESRRDPQGGGIAGWGCIVTSRSQQQPPQDDIVELTPLIRRTIRARVHDPNTADDLVQETLVRVIEARPRLTEGALASYAVVTSRNLVHSLARSDDRDRRHAHRVVDLNEPERPEDETLRREEQRAVATALARLSAPEREAMVAHEVMGRGNVAIAHDVDSTPGAVAVRLARARAKLRVDYVVALRRAELPTAECRRVLIALSAGDQRRQRTLDAIGPSHKPSSAGTEWTTAPRALTAAPSLPWNLAASCGGNGLPLMMRAPLSSGLRSCGNCVRRRPPATSAAPATPAVVWARGLRSCRASHSMAGFSPSTGESAASERLRCTSGSLKPAHASHVRRKTIASG